MDAPDLAHDTATATGSRFDRCLAAILRDRNGYEPDVDGPTNHGISQRLYDRFRESRALPLREVWGIEFREVESIYRTCFWEPAHAGEIPAPLDRLVFECAVESGPRWAIQTLQQALHLGRDGIFDRRVRRKLEVCDRKAVALEFLRFRKEFCRDLFGRHPECGRVFAHRMDRMDHLIAGFEQAPIA